MLRRALSGLVSGFIVGSVSFTAGVFYWEPSAPFDATGIPVILLIGGIFGIPLGVIVGVASGTVEYRTGWGVEWALAGALGALFTAVLSDGLAPRPTSMLLLLCALGALVVERSGALWFGDKRQDDRITSQTLVVLAIVAALIGIVYYAFLGFLVTVPD